MLKERGLAGSEKLFRQKPSASEYRENLQFRPGSRFKFSRYKMWNRTMIDNFFKRTKERLSEAGQDLENVILISFCFGSIKLQFFRFTLPNVSEKHMCPFSKIKELNRRISERQVATWLATPGHEWRQTTLFNKFDKNSKCPLKSWLTWRTKNLFRRKDCFR